MINILLVGLGPHARRIQFPILLRDGKQYDAQVKGIVDLDSQETLIRNYLEAKDFKEPIEYVFLNKQKSRIKNDHLDSALVAQLNALVKRLAITAVFICTEPACHTAYARWALSRDLHVFMDKPISAPPNLATDVQAASKIMRDYADLAELYLQKRRSNPGLVFEVMAQRRYHPAFHEISRLIREVKERTSTPITAFQTMHCDGQWRMPDEIVDQDYHPYNQGYGKCLHSGYHGIDITDWLVRQSHTDSQSIGDIEVFSNFVHPSDFLAQLPLENYNQLFAGFDRYRKYSPEILEEKYASFGEIDAQISTAYKDTSGKTLTVGQLSLQHTGFGQRNWPSAMGKDLYKGNGRVRQETHYLAQGPFQTIYFQSMQSEEILDESVNHSNVGGEYHLDIHIFRNRKMFPDWKSYEKLSLNDLSINILEGYSRGHQEDARRTAILTFLKSLRTPTTLRYADILDQKFAVGIIGAAYQSALNRKLGKNPLVSMRTEFEQRKLMNLFRSARKEKHALT